MVTVGVGAGAEAGRKGRQLLRRCLPPQVVPLVGRGDSTASWLVASNALRTLQLFKGGSPS